MTAQVYQFPGTARLSEAQKLERQVYQNNALLELLEKPTRSAANLGRQLKMLLPVIGEHDRATEVQELITRNEELKQLIEELTVGIAFDLMALEHEIKEGKST
jgi:hypothetical protein